METYAWIVAPTVTFLAVVVASFTVYTNHVWNRRQYAMQILSEWNAHTAPHRKAIEKIKPGIIDIPPESSGKRPEVHQFSPQEAEQIYLSKPEQENNWALRFHLIELGNYFEFICMAYDRKVADEEIIEIAFKASLMRWHEIMEHFITILKTNRGYHPWPPFDKVVNEWKTWPKPKGISYTGKPLKLRGASRYNL